MTTTVRQILERMRDLEEELEQELTRKGHEWHYRLEANRIRFEREVRIYHRRLKQSIPRFIREASLGNLLTAPLIYSVIVPLVVLDLWFTLYQRVCFPIYGIPQVPRSRYIVVDRHHLAYLNGIETLNCVYCGYANGLLAYAREIAGRTEQYWCPIKHAARLPASHSRYHLFVDYGDAAGYRRDLPRVRRSFDDVRPTEIPTDPGKTRRRAP